MLTNDLVLIEKFKQKFLRRQSRQPITQADLALISPTKKYADGRQKLLGTHLGASKRVRPQTSGKVWERRASAAWRKQHVILDRSEMKKANSWLTTR